MGYAETTKYIAGCGFTGRGARWRGEGILMLKLLIGVYMKISFIENQISKKILFFWVCNF